MDIRDLGTGRSPRIRRKSLCISHVLFYSTGKLFSLYILAYLQVRVRSQAQVQYLEQTMD